MSTMDLPPQTFEVAVARAIEAKSNSMMETFLAMDADGHGSITKTDFSTALRDVMGIDLSASHLDSIWNRFGLEEQEHGIRYADFVKYVRDTASAVVPSSELYGSFSNVKPTDGDENANSDEEKTDQHQDLLEKDSLDQDAAIPLADRALHGAVLSFVDDGDTDRTVIWGPILCQQENYPHVILCPVPSVSRYSTDSDSKGQVRLRQLDELSTLTQFDEESQTKNADPDLEKASDTASSISERDEFKTKKLPPQLFEIAVARKLESKTDSMMNIFLTLDMDGDGVVSKSDFQTALHNVMGIDLSDAEVDTIWTRFGSNAGEHGIRYAVFVKYIRETASASLPSSAIYGSLRNVTATKDIAEGKTLSTNGNDGMRPIQLPPHKKAQILKEQVHDILARHLSPQMGETDLFLHINTHKNGKITAEEFRDWLFEVSALELSTEQLKTVLGECYETGMTVSDFAKMLEQSKEKKDDPVGWGNGPLHRESIAVDRALGVAIHKCVDDNKTDHDILAALARKVWGQRASLIDAFNRYDVDGTGRLDARNLQSALSDAGIDVGVERVSSIMEKFDRDHDGKLKKGDFVRLITAGASEEEEANIPAERDNHVLLDGEDMAAIVSFRQALIRENLLARRAFQTMDHDQDKTLSMEDLRLGFDRLRIEVAPEHLDHIVSRFDTNHSGRLTYAQFVKLLSAKLDEA